MNKLRAGAAIMIAGLLSAGCAVTSMEAKIRPNVDVVQSTVGQGAVVALAVVDERATRDVGKRSAMGASIRMKEDLAAIIQTALADGLRRKGFTVEPGGTRGANMKVEIRGLAYDVTTGWFTGGIKTDAAMKVVATGGPGAPYEKMYRSNDEDRVIFVPGAKDNNAKLNAMVNNVLSQILNDDMLLTRLAQGGQVQVSLL